MGTRIVLNFQTAIAGSIDLRTYVSLFTSADGRIYLSLPDLGVEKTWMLKDLLKAAERLAQEYPVEEDQIPSLEVSARILYWLPELSKGIKKTRTYTWVKSKLYPLSVLTMNGYKVPMPIYPFSSIVKKKVRASTSSLGSSIDS